MQSAVTQTLKILCSVLCLNLFKKNLLYDRYVWFFNLVLCTLLVNERTDEALLLVALWFTVYLWVSASASLAKIAETIKLLIKFKLMQKWNNKPEQIAVSIKMCAEHWGEDCSQGWRFGEDMLTDTRWENNKNKKSRWFRGKRRNRKTSFKITALKL